MDIRILKGPDGGHIESISSKSATHRFLIAKAMSDGVSKIMYHQESEDTLATKTCLQGLLGESPMGKGTAPILDCKESGSTLRFLLPLSAALGKEVFFTLSPSLQKRPLSHLWEALEDHGVKLSSFDEGTIHLKGSLKPGLFTLPGDISSQYISGLLMSLPLLSGDSQLELSTELQSASYVDLTIEILEQAHIRINRKGNCFFIKGNQNYDLKGFYQVEGDWSNMAFWLMGGLLFPNKITCDGLSLSSNQGDKKILSIIEDMGGHVQVKDQSITCLPSELRGGNWDISQIPDLSPVISCGATFGKGTTILSNVHRLRLKESDRIGAIISLINTLGGKAEEKRDSIVIEGVDRLTGGTIDSFNDHRIVMMASILAGKCAGPVTIKNADAINKSYPTFFQEYEKLGGLLQSI